jgi:peptidoglycan/LPS O-acetylase OafA/YrhL
MTEIDPAKPVTFYLKGIAIAAVVINHYINDFLPGEFGGYASGIIAVFFVLSGYGIYFSFEKNASSRLTARQLLGFFVNRAIRIYPLYWTSLTLSAITLQTPYSLGVIMGNPFVKAPGIYWFISAIIQCYLVSPILYALMKRAGIKRYLAMVSIATLSVYFLQVTVLNNFPRTFAYRSFPFAHILLFASGLSMPQLVS